jgi:hypothetical protein
MNKFCHIVDCGIGKGEWITRQEKYCHVYFYIIMVESKSVSRSYKEQISLENTWTKLSQGDKGSYILPHFCLVWGFAVLLEAGV